MSNLFKKIAEKWRKMSKVDRYMTVFCIVIASLTLFNLYQRFLAPVDIDQLNRDLFDKYVDSAKEINYTKFSELAVDGLIDTVWYRTDNENMIFVVYTDDTINAEREDIDIYNYPPEQYYRTKYPAGDTFRQMMLSYGLNLILVRNPADSSVWISLMGALLAPIVMLITMTIIMRRTSAGDIKADDVLQKSDVEMEDIVGLDEIKGELNLIVNLIKDPTYGTSLGVRMPKGILLSGPAGVGKTMIAKAISKAANVPFMSVNGSDFQELYVGNGARHVRQVFRIARQHAPCIIFIDEFDAIGERRDSRRSDSEDSKTINAILKEMDGFTELQNVFVLAATNHPEKLDPSVIRPGRFDREIIIPPPRTWQVRRDMFKLYFKDKPLSEDVDLESLSRAVPGFTGADISVVCNEAAIVALSLEKKYIDTFCIEQAIDRKIFKGTKSKSLMNKRDREVVAYHEASHAVMSLLLKVPISRISIVSTTSGVGGAVFNEDKDSQFRTRTDFENDIMVCYAGRAGETLKFGEVTTGASNDIEQATEQIYNYLCTYGFGNSSPKINVSILQQHGVDVKDLFQDEIDGLSNEMWDRTIDKLDRHFRLVDKLAQHLLEVSMLSGKEVEEFLSEDLDKIGGKK